MKAHGFDMQGEIKIEGVVTLPTFTQATDQRRIIYVTGTNKFYIGTNTANGWREITFATDLNTFLISDGDQELDGDKVDIDYVPDNYTPVISTQGSPDITTTTDHLTAHLAGIDVAIATKASTVHAAEHITGGIDKITGDELDINWNPIYSTPELVTGTTTNLDNLTSHLKGIDEAIKDYARTKYFCFVPYESDDDTAVFNGTVGFCIPPSMTGMNIFSVTATTYAAGVGGTLSIQLRRSRAGTDVDILSTKCTIDSTEYSSTTAATPYVINTSNDDLVTGDLIFCDIDGVHSTTEAQGLSVIVEAQTV